MVSVSETAKCWQLQGWTLKEILSSPAVKGIGLVLLFLQNSETQSYKETSLSLCPLQILWYFWKEDKFNTSFVFSSFNVLVFIWLDGSRQVKGWSSSHFKKRIVFVTTAVWRSYGWLPTVANEWTLGAIHQTSFLTFPSIHMNPVRSFERSFLPQLSSGSSHSDSTEARWPPLFRHCASASSQVFFSWNPLEILDTCDLWDISIKVMTLSDQAIYQASYLPPSWQAGDSN